MSTLSKKADKLKANIKRIRDQQTNIRKTVVVTSSTLKREEPTIQKEKKRKSLREIFNTMAINASVLLATVRGVEASAQEISIQDPYVPNNEYVRDPEDQEQINEFVIGQEEMVTGDQTSEEPHATNLETTKNKTVEAKEKHHSISYTRQKNNYRVHYGSGYESNVRFEKTRNFLGGRRTTTRYSTPEERAANRARLAEIEQARIDRKNAEIQAAAEKAYKEQADAMKALLNKKPNEISLEEYVVLNNYYMRNGTDRERQSLNTKAEQRMQSALNNKQPLSMSDVEHLDSFSAAMLGVKRELMKEFDDCKTVLVAEAQKAHEEQQPAWKRWLKKTFGKKDQATVATNKSVEEKPWYSDYRFDREAIDGSLQTWAMMASKQSSNNMEKGLFKLPDEFRGIAQNMYRHARDHADENGNVDWTSMAGRDAKKFIAAKDAYEARKTKEAENKEKKSSYERKTLIRKYDRDFLAHGVGSRGTRGLTRR